MFQSPNLLLVISELKLEKSLLYVYDWSSYPLECKAEIEAGVDPRGPGGLFLLTPGFEALWLSIF